MNNRTARVFKDLVSPAEEKRKTARRQVAKMGSALVPELMLAAESEDPNLRWEAVDALGALGDRRATAVVLKRVLEDEDVHVRWRSIWAITCLDDGSVVFQLLNALRNGGEREARNAAVALSVFGRTEAVPKLLEGLKGDPFQQWESVNALGSVHNEETIPALIDTLTTGPPELRREAALSLGRTGRAEVADPLSAALRSDVDPEVRWRAAMSLGRLGRSIAAGELHEALEIEQDQAVREQIVSALRALEEEAGTRADQPPR